MDANHVENSGAARLRPYEVADIRRGAVLLRPPWIEFYPQPFDFSDGLWQPALKKGKGVLEGETSNPELIVKPCT